jgi:hypothetical protein
MWVNSERPIGTASVRRSTAVILAPCKKQPSASMNWSRLFGANRRTGGVGLPSASQSHTTLHGRLCGKRISRRD